MSNAIKTGTICTFARCIIRPDSLFHPHKTNSFQIKRIKEKFPQIILFYRIKIVFLQSIMIRNGIQSPFDR
ncbi:MAG TPA: hypothetical protein DEF88_03950 [Porphyromonadaceae bacterium]|nr:hypothetical protein [Porphyromonadaceae bacterium]